MEEDDGAACVRVAGGPSWVTAGHTWVEVLRDLARLLQGPDRTRMRQAFRTDGERMLVVELDATTCERAGDLAETLQSHTLDALHFAVAERAGAGSLPFLTYDVRQAQGCPLARLDSSGRPPEPAGGRAAAPATVPRWRARQG